MHFQVVTTFLQTLFEGRKSLYRYFNYSKEYFYIRQGTTFDLLLYKKYLTEQGDNSILNENKTFVGQLRIYLNDCPGIEDKIDKTGYDESDLNKLFRFYYESTDSGSSFTREVEKRRAETGLLAGCSVSSLIFMSTTYFTQTDFSHSVNFSAGLFFDLIIPRNHGKWSILNELILTSYDVSGTYKSGPENYYTQISSELGFIYLKINTMGRF